MNSYTAIYRSESLCGESGWTYQCFYQGREIFNGWTRGKKRDAEVEVRRGIDARETLLSATQGVN